MFDCNRCGLCCENLHQHDLYQVLPQTDGVCHHFDAQRRLCRIYETRPLICRIDDFYDTLPEPKMTRSEYHRRNHEGCEQIRQIRILPAPRRG